MAAGWNVITRRPDPEGGPDVQGCVVVRLSDREGAIALVQDKMPEATVSADSEASLQFLETLSIQPGEALVVFEGQ
jgi:hypothetical protein